MSATAAPIDVAIVEPLPPWLVPAWRRVWAARCADRLGHALLLTGPAGIGKRRLAARLAAALLCARPDDGGIPCGHCPECGLLHAGSHPDWRRLEIPPEAGVGQEIRVDQIRELIHETALTGHRGVCRVVGIAPAESMNRYAANALLKTLEEPGADVVLVLVSETPSALPATVRSRCHRVGLCLPPAQQALDWLRSKLPTGRADEVPELLRVAQGAPLRALALCDGEQKLAYRKVIDGLDAVGRGEQDPVAVAHAWQSLETALVLRAVAAWVSDVLRLQADPAADHITHSDRRSDLVRLAASMSALRMHRFLQFVLQSLAQAGTSVNTRMLFESLLARWALVTGGGH